MAKIVIVALLKDACRWQVPHLQPRALFLPLFHHSLECVRTGNAGNFFLMDSMDLDHALKAAARIFVWKMASYLQAQMQKVVEKMDPAIAVEDHHQVHPKHHHHHHLHLKHHLLLLPLLPFLLPPPMFHPSVSQVPCVV